MTEEVQNNQVENNEVLPEGLAQEQAEVASQNVNRLEQEIADENAGDEGEEYNGEYGHDWGNIQAVCDEHNIPADWANQVFNEEYRNYEQSLNLNPEQADKMRMTRLVEAAHQAKQSQEMGQQAAVRSEEANNQYHAEELEKHFPNMTLEQLADKIYIHNLGAADSLVINPDLDTYEVQKLKMMTGAAPAPNSAYASKAVEFNSQVDHLLTKHGLDMNVSDEQWHKDLGKVKGESPGEFAVLAKVRKQYHHSLVRNQR